MTAQQFHTPIVFGAPVPDGVKLSYARQAKDPRDCAAYIETPHGVEMVYSGQWVVTEATGERRIECSDQRHAAR